VARRSSFLSHQQRLAPLPKKPQVGATQLDAWRTIQRGARHCHGTYVAVVNRRRLRRRSEKPGFRPRVLGAIPCVADPFGQITAHPGSEKEEILVVECDSKKSEETRRNRPLLRDSLPHRRLPTDPQTAGSAENDCIFLRRHAASNSASACPPNGSSTTLGCG